MRFRWRNQVLYVSAALLGVLLAVFMTVRFSHLRSRKDTLGSQHLSVNQDIEHFLRLYWQRPIPLQGLAPASFTEKEVSLRPEACGSCHAQQHADWRESLHSKSMSPGPWGQIMDLSRNSPGGAIQCMTCHAPLSEQMPFIPKTVGGAETPYEKNAYFDAQLQMQGITCAACHVRRHQHFGPPKSEGAAAAEYPAGTPNHGGVQRTPYFRKAEFCKDCHQFDPENTVLVNGKPIQDTYREWKNSIWGQGKAACQDCHMPNRRHLWRGIHDPEWVKEGVRVEVALREPRPTPGDPVELTVEVVNAAVGHKFPTYVTPKVFVRAALLDHAAKSLPGTQQEKIIGWDARFEGGEWKEYSDTRIPPGEKFQGLFRWNLPIQAKRVRVWVEVHPDHFYHVHFYPTYLKSQGLTPESRKLIEKALGDSGRSSYVLFEKILPLK